MEENCFNASHAGLERVNKEAERESQTTSIKHGMKTNDTIG